MYDVIVSLWNGKDEEFNKVDFLPFVSVEGKFCVRGTRKNGMYEFAEIPIGNVKTISIFVVGHMITESDVVSDVTQSR